MTTPQRRITKAYRVPYWIAGLGTKPPIWRHPIERLRGWWWTRT